MTATETTTENIKIITLETTVVLPLDQATKVIEILCSNNIPFVYTRA